MTTENGPEMQSDSTLPQDMGSSEYTDSSSEEMFVTEEKKPLGRGTLVMFAILLVGGALTYFMYLRSSPQQAKAGSDDASKTIKEFLNDGGKSIKDMRETLKNAEKVVEQLQNPTVQQVPLAELPGNPFEIEKKVEEAKATPKNDRQEEEERKAALQAVRGLQLQTVMHSDKSKSCMINNTLYQEGQQVDRFIIEKIQPGSVIVKTGNYRFELRMQR